MFHSTVTEISVQERDSVIGEATCTGIFHSLHIDSFFPFQRAGNGGCLEDTDVFIFLAVDQIFEHRETVNNR